MRAYVWPARRSACHAIMLCLHPTDMIRTQVRLTEQQMRQLRKVAARDGISIAEVIRRCIDRGIGDRLSDADAAYEAAARCVGSFRDRDEAGDVAAQHDRYLADAFE
jgi:hypothetical protein